MNKLRVSHAPHIHAQDSVKIIMQDVIIALIPSMFAGVLFMGYRSFLLVSVCAVLCVLFEALWQLACKKPVTVTDLSAVVTGILLAMNLPVTIPFWMAAIGCLFAIVVVKQMFGGLGCNIMNPALAARAFLLTSWPAAMTNWVNPGTKITLFGQFQLIDGVSHATPLALIKGTEAAGAALPSYWNLFIGNVGGCIGEVSTLALLIGAAYLFIRKIISWKIPLAFIGTVALFTCIFGGSGFFTGDWIYHILSGGLMLGAFFMATDYTTSPITPKGQIIFGIGCGLLTAVIRLWGGYPEGVSYAILLMNVATPLIERATAPKRFGVMGGKEDVK